WGHARLGSSPLGAPDEPAELAERGPRQRGLSSPVRRLRWLGGRLQQHVHELPPGVPPGVGLLMRRARLCALACAALAACRTPSPSPIAGTTSTPSVSEAPQEISDAG